MELKRLAMRRRRGFTLIEIALAMVVVGTLLGASALTARHLEEKRQLQGEMQRLERVRDAIVGYAIRNRTRDRVLKVVPWFGPGGEWEFRLPAGRPYLPCPDFDGDGYEDRVPWWAFQQGVEVKPDLTVTVTVGELAGADDGHLTWTHNSSGGVVAHPYGECRVERGTVPWRTLGVEPSDGWGNRHTYFADPVFSNAIFGFDRQTVADAYDPRVPSAPGYGPSQRLHKDVFGDLTLPEMITAPRPNTNARGNDVRGCPAAICIGNIDDDGGSACEPARSSGNIPGVRKCAWRIKDKDNPTVFKGGLVTAEEIPGRKYYLAGSVVDGLPFVLVSHGPNGRHAVNHWATLQNRNRVLHSFLSPIREFFFPICNPAWQSTDHPIIRIPNIPEDDLIQHFESANAARTTPTASGYGFCIIPEGRFAGDSMIYNLSSFVWQPPGVNDKSDFDDMLLWGTRGELSTRIPGNIPRLPRMVIAYFGPD